MKELFTRLVEELDNDRSVMLVNIVEGSGSIPRTAGAYMLVGEQGRIYGTIGGGNLEYQATITGQKLLKDKKNYLQEYHLNMEHAANLGMVCGGDAKVLYYYLDSREKADVEFVQEVLSACHNRKQYWLMLPLGEGKAYIKDDVKSNKLQTIIETDGKKYYAEKFFYDGKVYLFGGGHLAQETVPLLSHLGFRCIVSDDRDEFTRPELFVGAELVKKVDFTKLDEDFTILPNDYIIVMTRGHVCDTDVERFALRTSASYIGVVGSARKTKFVREILKTEGFTDKELDRIITPIGLPIKSETPAEIAVSIAAQLIEFRASKYDV